MRTATSRLTLRRPRNLTDALTMLRDEGPLTAIAGCTDIYVGLQFGTLEAQRFVDLWALDELRGIEQRGDTIRLGALTTYSELIRSPLVQQWLPMLVSAAREVGGRQIQNRGTLGGNIANSSPAGDTLPVFAAAEATLVLRSADNERRIPFAEFYTGYRASVLRHDELIGAIEVPRVHGRQWWRKVGARRAQAISKVMLAAVRPSPATGGRAADGVRLALGSVAPTVRRLPRAEAVLGAGGTIDEACRILVEEIEPIDDVRSTADYRRTVSANLVARFWSDTA
ncbi:MAG: FAD binding domain-containing protein [Acidobacteria bacterium]|nr:FAD binding domain-containing protein [Acidobacteriota bacterium]